MSGRATFFVCSTIVNQKIASKTIKAINSQEASTLFLKEFGQIPQDITGPFIKKRVSTIPQDVKFKCTHQTRKALYGEWLVNAFILDEPIDQAYLVFLRRADEKKEKLPQGTIVVPISDLRFI